MPFGISTGSTGGGSFSVDVPPQDGGDSHNFGLTLQFEANGTPLGAADATIVDFRDGIVATRDGDRISVSVPTSSDSELIGGFSSDGTGNDNLAAIVAALGVQGSFVAGKKPRAKFATTGQTLINGIFDIHPAVSIPNDGRGQCVLVPGDNLPASTSNIPGSSPPYGAGADAAFVRIVRDSIDSALSLAYSPVYRGFNLDARNTSQIHPVHGARLPNPDPSKNSEDGDPDFTGNKDYVAGEWYNVEVIGWPGSGITIEAGNGRFHGHSIRGLNCGLIGIDLGGNDVAMSGHWAVGGCDQWSLKVGQATGFYATTGNMWSNPATQSVNSGSVFFNQRKYFALGYSEFNAWCRLDGGSADATGGSISHNLVHQHGVNFDADGVGHNALADGDTRLNSNFGIKEYKNLSFWGNVHVRTDPVGNSGTYTVDPSTDTFTTSKNNLANGNIVYTVPNAPTGVLAAGLQINTPYYVVNYHHSGSSSTFQLSLTLGGSAIDITDAGTAEQNYTTFPTLGNFGGVGLDGSLGTAPQTLIDVSTGGSDGSCATGDGTAMVSVLEPLCSRQDVKAWTDVLHVVESVTDDGNGNLLITKTAHGFQTNHRVGYYCTGTPPTNLAVNRTVYYVDIDNVSNPDDTYLLSTDPIENNSPTHVAFSSAGSGTLYYTSLSTFPLLQGHGNQIVYGLSDSYLCSWRFGARGPVLSHIALGINEDDDFNFAYRVEIGDRGNFARNIIYGMTEFDQGITYTDAATITTSTTEGGNRTVKHPTPIQYFSTTGGGISVYTVNFETGKTSSYRGILEFIGGPIANLLWGTTGGGTINQGTGTIKVPRSSPGALRVEYTYRRSTNDIRIDKVSAGAAGMPMGRTDGSGAGAGVVGEIQRDFLPGASAVPLTTATPANTHTLTLTAGRYLLFGTFGFSAVTATGLTATQWGIGTVSATLPTTKDESYGAQQWASASVDATFLTGFAMKLVDVAQGASDSTQTFYSVQQADFSGGSVKGYGTLIALRIG